MLSYTATERSNSVESDKSMTAIHTDCSHTFVTFQTDIKPQFALGLQ